MSLAQRTNSLFHSYNCMLIMWLLVCKTYMHVAFISAYHNHNRNQYQQWYQVKSSQFYLYSPSSQLQSQRALQAISLWAM